MSKKTENKLPFDVVRNLGIFNGEFHQHLDTEDIVEKIKKKENFKGVVKLGSIPITTTQEQMELYLNDVPSYYQKSYNFIPFMSWEVETNDEKEITSITLIQKIKGKYYKVISDNDYGILKSRFQLDEKGNFKNYEKCKLIPYNGEMKIYSLDKSDKYRVRLHEDFTHEIKDGVLDGVTVRNYKGGYETETTTYKKGKKEGLYENTQSDVKGNYVNGKKDGDWKEKLNLWDFIKGDKSDSSIRDILSEFRYSLDDNHLYNVKYNNGVLDGEFSKEGYPEVKGYFMNGLVCGDLELKKHNKTESFPFINNKLNGVFTITENETSYSKKEKTITYKMGEFVEEKQTNTIGWNDYQSIKNPNHHLIFWKNSLRGYDRENYRWMNDKLIKGFHSFLPNEVSELLKEYEDMKENNYQLVYFNIGEVSGGILDEDGRWENKIKPSFYENNMGWYWENYHSLYGFVIGNEFYVMNEETPLLINKNWYDDWYSKNSNHYEDSYPFPSEESKKFIENWISELNEMDELRSLRKKKEEEEKEEETKEKVSLESFPMD